MNKRLLIIFALIFVGCSSSQIFAQVSTDINRIHAKQKAYELSVLWKEISYNFGNMNNCERLDIDSLYRAYLPKVTETKDDFEYWKTLQCFMAHFNNGHTKVFGAPDYLVKHLAYPLLATTCHDGHVMVENFGARMAGKLHVGDTILTINGQDVMEYFQEKHVPYVSASNKSYKIHDAMFAFNNSNCCLNYSDTKYRLGIKTPEGVKEVDVHADYYLDPGKRDRNDRFYTGGNYWRTLNSFVLDTTSGFAYIALTVCNQSFSDYFIENYDDIQKAENLIVDISYNMGGYSSFCDTVIGYLVDNDSIFGPPVLNRLSKSSVKASSYFISDANKEVEIDVSKKQEYYLNHSFESRNYQEPEYERVKNPVPASQRYHGNIYVLMGSETVSAAEFFAVKLSQNKRVVFMGEKTAGANAQPYYFVLPSGIKAMINIGRCYNFENQEVSSGFPPDYELDLFDLFYPKSRRKLFTELINIIHSLNLKG